MAIFFSSSYSLQKWEVRLSWNEFFPQIGTCEAVAVARHQRERSASYGYSVNGYNNHRFTRNCYNGRLTDIYHYILWLIDPAIDLWRTICASTELYNLIINYQMNVSFNTHPPQYYYASDCIFCSFNKILSAKKNHSVFKCEKVLCDANRVELQHQSQNYCLLIVHFNRYVSILRLKWWEKISSDLKGITFLHYKINKSHIRKICMQNSPKCRKSHENII